MTSEFPAQTASNAKDISIWWRHHESERSIGNYHRPFRYRNYEIRVSGYTTEHRLSTTNTRLSVVYRRLHVGNYGSMVAINGYMQYTVKWISIWIAVVINWITHGALRDYGNYCCHIIHATSRLWEFYTGSQYVSFKLKSISVTWFDRLGYRHTMLAKLLTIKTQQVL